MDKAHIEYDAKTLEPEIRSRFLQNTNGLTMHVLEAGYEDSRRPCVLLLHGFPELAYSWRKLLVPLARAGYHVVAPDQRGYGRTTGWEPRFDVALESYRMLNLVRDIVGLVRALGREEVAAVVGHDFGSPVAAWCSLLRPDIFRRVVLMSAPFGGPPAIEPSQKGPPQRNRPVGFASDPMHAELAKLTPPRKHYQLYYSGEEANENMWHCPQGLHEFLRAYYHVKSDDWAQNEPHPLGSWSAGELAKLPGYYIMPLEKGMAETVEPYMPNRAEIAGAAWLTDEELEVYSAEFRRTGFQGGLSWYRAQSRDRFQGELQLFSGRRIEVPALFVAGVSDWGVYQKPGVFEAMQTKACADFRGAHLIEGAGHWVQQEQPERVLAVLQEFSESR